MGGLQANGEAQHELVIVGAGLEALHIVSRLPEGLLKGCVVVDASGAWLSAWSRQCSRLGVGALRTPAGMHPHPAPAELGYFAEESARQEELTRCAGAAPALPTAALLRDFCLARLVPGLPEGVRQPLRDTATRIEPLPGAGCRVHLASGGVLAARAVVVATSQRRPVIPAALRRYFGPAAEERLPSSRLQTWDGVDLGAELAPGQRVVVIGGGMASATLAVNAAAAGAAVTLVSRRELRQQAYECPVGWWGSKELNAYGQAEDLGARLAACRRARGQATIHQPLWDSLAAAAAAGRVQVVEGVEVEAAELEAAGSGSDGGSAACPWRVALRRSEIAGGTSPTATASAFQQAVAALEKPSPAEGTPAAAEPPSTEPGALEADAIWVACGSAFDAGAHPLLAALQAERPTSVVGGYPRLDDGCLVWPGAPVFVIGRGAMLAVGPCAGDLAGMRLAADRILPALKRLDYAGEPVWVVAAQQRLAALPAAAGDAAGGGGVPLEAEGRPYVEPRYRRSVAKPEHLIDVSDLPADLPRVEAQRYSFTDDGEFEVCVIIQLQEAVPREQVRVRFGERSLEAWAVGSAAAVHLHLPLLYSRVVPKRCSYRVSPKSKKLYLVLHKVADAEWRFLKG